MATTVTTATKNVSLREYIQKRDFQKSAEPKPARAHKGGHRFVIQKHAASRLHYDFRLEMDGVLKSWAVPKGVQIGSEGIRKDQWPQRSQRPQKTCRFANTFKSGTFKSPLNRNPRALTRADTVL